MLTKRFVQNVKEPGTYADARGDGLLLRVRPGGAKAWIQRITIKGRRRDLGLGSARFVSLDEAREQAFANMKIARRGGDPRAEERTVPDFAEALESVIALHSPSWRDKRAPGMWRAAARDYCKGLSRMPVDGIGPSDVLAILAPLWNAKRRTAERVRTIVAAVFKWSVAQGYRTDDPMMAITAMLPRSGANKNHHRAASHAEIGGALARLRDASGWAPVALALEFVALTATRSGEVRGATWGEIDLEARTWTVPASRMKTNREHRVPLSTRAVEVLEAARPFADESGLIFPSSRGGPLPDNALSRLVHTAGLREAMTVHGLRSSFRDWCAETGKRREDAEAALAHARGEVEAAYFRSDLFERRRVLMQAWSDFLTGSETKVVSFPA